MFVRQYFFAFLQLTNYARRSMAQKVNIHTAAVPCKRLKAVKGDDIRENDVVVCGFPQTAKTHVLYFGGDVQDYKERMCVNNPAYDYWDLETTARIIQQRFPQSAVFVIKPSEMFLNTFSIYRNFLQFDEEARPDFSYMCGAIQHLKSVYLNANKLMKEDSSASASSSDSECSGADMTNGRSGADTTNGRSFTDTTNCRLTDEPEISLIGFSKGCVVLNQLMFELKHYRTAKEAFLTWIKSIYWLDGGHTGGHNAYITDEETLDDIVKLNIKLFVHVTPYQVNDPMRTWIGKEEVKFIEMLKEKGANVIEKRHFTDEPASILNHFRVLKVF